MNNQSTTSSPAKPGYILSKETCLFLDALRQLNEAYNSIYDAVDSTYPDVDAMMERRILPQFRELQNAVLGIMGNCITGNLLEQDGEAEITI